MLGLDLKTSLVLSQLLGYTLSKFIGSKLFPRWMAENRAITIIGLIALSETRLGWLRFSAGAIQMLMIF